MPSARGRNIINRNIINELKNKPWHTAFQSSNRDVSFLLANEKSPPTSYFNLLFFCLVTETGRAALVSLGLLGLAAPAMKCLFSGFISAAPPGRPFSSSRLLDTLVPQRYRPHLWSRSRDSDVLKNGGRGEGEGLLIPAIFMCELLIMWDNWSATPGRWSKTFMKPVLKSG